MEQLKEFTRHLLKGLIDSDFVRTYNGLVKKERENIYQLSDLFSLL